MKPSVCNRGDRCCSYGGGYYVRSLKPPSVSPSSVQPNIYSDTLKKGREPKACKAPVWAEHISAAQSCVDPQQSAPSITSVLFVTSHHSCSLSSILLSACVYVLDNSESHTAELWMYCNQPWCGRRMDVDFIHDCVSEKMNQRRQD